jgi:hypothetical protein
MKTNYEIIQEINTLSKNYYKDNALALAFAWGCAQSLLSTEQLEIILRVIREQETN